MIPSSSRAKEEVGAHPVLVVDDDADLRTLLALALGRAGLETIEASSGPEALDIVRSQPLGVVVCDLMLPGLSGLDVVRALRQAPETSTLPVLLMTGSGDADSLIAGLEAGADDFLAKPVRLEELVARVRAHLRTHDAWRSIIGTDLQARVDNVRAIGQLTLSAVPEEAAASVVTELARRTGSSLVGVLQLSPGGRLVPLAVFNSESGVVLGGPSLPPSRARTLLARARAGPWSERVGRPDQDEESDVFWTAPPELFAGAPIYAGQDLVAVLTIGVNVEPSGESEGARLAKLMASAIDYAGALSSVAGPAIADRRQAASERGRLRAILAKGDFHSVYQPIVRLETAVTVGHEALTRFDDGVAPDLRFAEAGEAGLGPDFQLAAVYAAVEGARTLPLGAYLSVNLSPDVLIGWRRRLASLLAAADRPIVLEVTEHARIPDYAAFRKALARIPGVSLAVDDAGAGFASLRHILELSPTYAKLDVSLVRGVDGDPLRQAMAAGLAYFATRTGCSLVAEGVEHQPEADMLLSLGVEYAQGYLFGRPQRPPGRDAA